MLFERKFYFSDALTKPPVSHLFRSALAVGEGGFLFGNIMEGILYFQGMDICVMDIVNW